MELDLLDDEPTVLEYARLHGLCTDYAQNILTLSIACISQNDFDQDLRDPHSAPAVTNPAGEITRERLTLNKQAALLLHRSIHPHEEDQFKISFSISDERQRLLGLKQEAPLLRTDHELDMLHFGSKLMPTFRDTNIPLEPVDEEKDEGLEWPSNFSLYPAQCYKQAESEKFEVSRDSLVHLQKMLKDQVKPQDMEVILAQYLNYKMRRPTQPITPPLLPLTPPMTPYIPSSPANNIPLLSEDSNSTTAEATSLQNEIMAADALFRHDFNGDDPMHLDTNAREELSFNLKTRGNDGKRKLEDVKVEGPLTPPIFSDSPLKKIKSVSFSAMVQFIPEIPSTYENGEDILCPEDDFAGFYQDTIPLVEDANGRISNERLSVADTTKRVDVPYLEFPLPVMPWGEYKKPYNNSNGTELDAQTKFMLHVKRFSMKTAETWYGVAKLEKNLRWEPAPTHMFKVPVDEKLHGEENLCKLLQDPNPGDVVTCASAIWHGDRLRILENDDEEEELEHQEYEDEWNGEKMDLSALARKRKLELDEAEDNAECGNKALKRRVTKPNDDPRSKRAAARHSPVGDRCKIGGTRSPSSHPNNSQIKTRKKPSSLRIETHASLMFGGKFSASNSLENFLAIQGMSLAPLKVHKQPPSTEPAPVPLPPKDQQHNSASTSANIDPDHKIQQHRPPPPLAPIPDHLLPCSFIMSSTLLQQRHLSKQIGQLYPAAEFVTRDFALPHSTSQEADLLLSPSTGLIVTTLQQVKQRALPGQPDHSPLKSRIATLQHRYERLVVLITEGLTREMESHGSTRPPDVRDQDAVRVFEAFASGLEGEALVHYVPGGETALARSVVGEMARYGLAHGSADIGDIKPLPDETNWELFLRRAGLNPFAAQAILAWLKQPVEYPLASSSPASGSAGQAHTVRTFGLQTFLMMSADRRVQNFQAMLGGARVLRRVSGVLDGEWVSAAHGYRM